MAKMLGDALRLLKNKYPEEEFPTIKEDDPDSVLEDGYLCIEAKNILTAVLLADLWDELKAKNSRFGLPDPAECPPGFRLSTAKWWPGNSRMEGVAGYAADKQIDTVADISFTRIMVCCGARRLQMQSALITSST